MVGVIVISESRASAEMLKTLEKVLGKSSLQKIEAVTIRSDFSQVTLKNSLSEALCKIGAGHPVIIFTELYGSTQSNVCREFLVKDEIEMIAGYNFPMLLKAAMLNQTASLQELIKQVCLTGKKCIKVFQK